MRQFELLGDLQPSRSAKAVLLKWNGNRYIRTDEKIELHDFVGVHGNRGDRGYTIHNPESGHWEAVAGLYQQVAGWIPS